MSVSTRPFGGERGKEAFHQARGRRLDQARSDCRDRASDVAGGLTRNVGVAAGVCERQTCFASDVASGPFAVDIQRQRFRSMCITDARMSGVAAPDRS